ncbi:MAG: permease, partial [Bacteroidales bacterium]|nr:permease [Bacteroidales bacterium]
MNYLVPFISLLNEMSPYLLLGFLIAGVLKVFVPNDKFISHLSRSDFKSVLWSALVGVPLTLCSCGVIPTGMSLRKEGASRGATVAFLISTPQTGADSIAATYSVLGLPFALLRPVAAFITSLFGGLLVNRFDGDNSAINSDLKSSTKSDEEEYRNKNKLMRVLHYSFVEMLQDIGKWLILGILFAGLIAIFLPDSVFSTYLNNPLLNMLIVLAVAVPTYTCATGSIPMAAALMMKGLSPGAAL